MGHKRHAQLGYFLYYPFEFAVDTLRVKGKDWMKTKNESREEIDVQGKVVVITGANAGLGKCTAKEMAKRGAVVVMGCRDLERGAQARTEIMDQTGSKTVELYHLDLSDFSTVRAFATVVLQNHVVIDILINNAGIALNNTKQQRTEEGWDLQMTTNHLGHFLLTNLLITAILPSSISRVVIVSSTGCIPSTLDVNDLMMTRKNGKKSLGFWCTKPYQNSKMANALFMKSLAKRYPSLKVYSLCPGLVRTEVFRHYERRLGLWETLQVSLDLWGVEVEQGADTILLCSLGKQVETESGGFFRFGRRLKGVENMLKEEVAEELWNVSEKYVGLDDKV